MTTASATPAPTAAVGAAGRPSLWDSPLSAGKKTRLYRMLYQFGPRNGTFLILPLDQGLEHGPVDFFDNPESLDTDYIFRLALAGNFSAVAIQPGLAEKYYPKYAGRIPLLLKINGRTNVPSSDDALSTLTGSVDDAVRLGAGIDPLEGAYHTVLCRTGALFSAKIEINF